MSRSRKKRRRRDDSSNSDSGDSTDEENGGGKDRGIHAVGHSELNGDKSNIVPDGHGQKLTGTEAPPPSAAATQVREAATEEKKAASRSMAPMSREEYEAQRSVIREVFDPDTGRTRLVRGDGEILERIVSREDHARINRMATAGDGRSFSVGVSAAAASSFSSAAYK